MAARSKFRAPFLNPHRHISRASCRSGVDANSEFAAACETGDPRLVVETNWAFHDAINQACGNQYMAADCSKMLRGVMRLSELAFRQNDTSLADYNVVVAQHQEMIEAIRVGDADRAEELAYLHSAEFRDRMKTFIYGKPTSELSLGERKIR